MLKLSFRESDETGGDVSLVVGQLLYAALVVAAAAACAADAGATRDTAAVTMSGLCHCTHTQTHTTQAIAPSKHDDDVD